MVGILGRQPPQKQFGGQSPKFPQPHFGPSAPLQTEFSCFCEMKYLLEKETHNKNEDNTLKELNEIFLMVCGLPK